ncbi:MAG: hypothetical protein U5M23_15400 [Marinagarivorans sp.]|nr:hypothetical protein [Marinagarivorans sp.]
MRARLTQDQRINDQDLDLISATLAPLAAISTALLGHQGNQTAVNHGAIGALAVAGADATLIQTGY